jgi:hypothetical protein
MKKRQTQNRSKVSFGKSLATLALLLSATTSSASFEWRCWNLLLSALDRQVSGCFPEGTGWHYLQTYQDCQIELQIEVFDASCPGVADGSLLMDILNGTPPYIIDWDNDGTGDNDDPEDLSGLSPGTYDVTVTDDEGCTAEASFDVAEPNPIDLPATVNNATTPNGSDGSIDLSPSGGTQPYQFEWDYDGTGDNDDPEDLTNLEAGTYFLTLSDANGCTAAATFMVDAPDCGAAIAGIASDATCFAGTDGTVALSITGGMAPFTVDWDNDGTGDNDDPEDLTN